MVNPNNVAIVGFGTRSAAGWNTLANAVSVECRIASFSEHPYLIDKAGNKMVVSMMPGLSDEVQGCDRFLALAVPAMGESIKVLEQSPESMHQCELVLGLPSAREGLPDNIDEQLSNELPNRFPWLTVNRVHSFTNGHAAGLMALQKGCQLVASGEADWCLVGGIDSYLSPETLEWMDDNDSLHSSTTTWGFIPGEAAAFCLLASSTVIDQLQLPVLCEVAAGSTALEDNKSDTDTVCTGDGLTEAIADVARYLGDAKFDNIWCDQNGERYRAAEFGFTSMRLAEHFHNPDIIHAPARCWGDVGAASGPLFAAMSATISSRNADPVSRSLLWASSVTGERSAVLLNLPTGQCVE